MTAIIDNSDVAINVASTVFSLTIPAFTVSANDNKRLFVSLTVDGFEAPPTVSFVRDGASLTFLDSYFEAATGRPVYVYELLQPSNGSFDIVGTFSTSLNHPTMTAVSLHDADQGSLTAVTSGGNAATLTASAIPAVVGDLVLGFGAWNNTLNSGLTETGTGQTSIVKSSPGAFGVLGFISSKVATATSEALSWSATSNNNGVVAFSVASIATGPSITQTDDTPEDGVQQTVTATGMTGPVTGATLGGVSIALDSTDPSSPITYTYDISSQAIETNQPQPRLGIPVDLVFTTATDGAVSTSVTIGPKTGWSVSELEDVLNKDANGYLATIEATEGITITSADASYYDTSSNANITVNGVYSSDLTTAGQSTKSILQVGATSPATSYSDNFYPYGQIVAPILTSPTGASTGETTASGTVTTDTGDGTLYYLFSENATELAATIKAANSQAVTATGLQSVTYTGLTVGTTYYPHYIQTDAALDDSNVSTGSSFTTGAPVRTILLEAYSKYPALKKIS